MSILLSLQAVGSQAADQMPDLTAVTLPTEAEINVIDLAFKGGWIMVVLLLLSLKAFKIRPAACSRSLEGIAISAFTVSYTVA